MPAGWASSTGRSIRGSTGTSRSSCSRPSSRRTVSTGPGSFASRGRRRRSSIRASFPSMTPATRTGCCTSRCATSTGPISVGRSRAKGRWLRTARSPCSPRSLTRWTPPTREVSCIATSSRATCSCPRRTPAVASVPTLRTSASASSWRGRPRSPRPVMSSVPPSTSHPSWSRGVRSTVAPTCTRSAACSSSAWPASLHSSGKPPSPCSGHTSTTCRRR